MAASSRGSRCTTPPTTRRTWSSSRRRQRQNSGSRRVGWRSRPGGTSTCPRLPTARTVAGTRSTTGSASWASSTGARTTSACQSALYAASDDEICLFLRHLWATDGCVWLPHGKSAAKVYYASSSRELADGVAHLLARLGIVARIRQVEKAGYEPGYHVIVADAPSLRTFCARVGVHGRRGETARELGALAGRPGHQHQRGHGAAWRVEPGQVGASPRRAHRAAVPGRHRDALLRDHPLQELPVSRAPDAVRGRLWTPRRCGRSRRATSSGTRSSPSSRSVRSRSTTRRSRKPTISWQMG